MQTLLCDVKSLLCHVEILCDVTLLCDVNCLLCDLSNLFNDVLTLSFDV